MIYRAILFAMALGFTPGALAAECRTVRDAVGAGLAWTECSDGYRAEEQLDGIGAGIIHGEDNRGHTWTTRRSAIGAGSWTEMW